LAFDAYSDRLLLAWSATQAWPAASIVTPLGWRSPVCVPLIVWTGA
jgi:hypothetical protein